MRWYLEDYLEYPLDPAPGIARDVEQRLAELGRDLFSAVFGSAGGQRLWARIQDELPDLRIEISTEVADATALPWELLRDPVSDDWLALAARSFVRVNHSPSRP